VVVQYSILALVDLGPFGKPRGDFQSTENGKDLTKTHHHKTVKEDIWSNVNRSAFCGQRHSSLQK
jgi:hypothetical protein